MRSTETIAGRYERLGGFTSGFDYARIFLSIAVMAVHGYGLVNPDNMKVLWHSWPRPILAFVLPAFFALSGFLVTGSLLRQSALIPFVTLRVVRLIPALAVEVTLSALVLGPLLTSLTLAQYFSDPLFFRYLLNIAGHISFYLPGVFLGPENFGRPGIVNQSLWTIPFELKCYIALVGLTLFGITRRRILFLGITIALLLVGTWKVFNITFDSDTVGGNVLVFAFLVGACLALYKDMVPLSFPLFIAAVVVAFASFYFDSLRYVAMIPSAYIITYLGMQTPPKHWVVSSGDYSYGIYLFAFPIQQTYFLLFPNYPYFFPSLLFALPLTFIYAYFSWHVVEKPILAKKKVIANAAQSSAMMLRRGITSRLGISTS